MLPRSEEAEIYVLSHLIQSPEAYDKLSSYLFEDVFYDNKNKKLFKLIKYMISENETLDKVTVCGRLSEDDKNYGLDAHFVMGLPYDSITSYSGESYAKQVYQKYLLRSVILKTSSITDAAYKNNSSVYNLLDEANTEITKLIEIRPNISFSMAN